MRQNLPVKVWTHTTRIRTDFEYGKTVRQERWSKSPVETCGRKTGQNATNSCSCAGRSFGKTPEVRDVILSWNAASGEKYRAMRAHVVDATQPLAAVVAAVRRFIEQC